MKYYIGVDVGKYSLDMFDGKSNLSFKNTDEGIKELIAYILCQGKEKLFVIYEATGGYEQALGKFLSETNISYKRVHPNKVRHFAKSIGYLAKTDRLDARVLRMYGECNELEKSDEMLNEKTAELKALLVRREQLLDEKVKELNRLDKIVNSQIRDSIEEHIKWLEEEIKRIEKQIKQHVRQDSEIKKDIELYQSIKGIGFLTATYMVTHLPELGKIEHSQLSALVGVAPMNCDSGKKKGKRKVQAGRAGIRKILYMATLSAIRFNKDIKVFYERLMEKGKLFKVSMTAAMRKLIIMINSVAKRGTPWQETWKAT